MSDQIGSVATGMNADLVVTDADPISDLAALRQIGMVLQAGRIVRDELTSTASRESFDHAE